MCVIDLIQTNASKCIVCYIQEHKKKQQRDICQVISSPERFFLCLFDVISFHFECAGWFFFNLRIPFEPSQTIDRNFRWHGCVRIGFSVSSRLHLTFYFVCWLDWKYTPLLFFSFLFDCSRGIWMCAVWLCLLYKYIGARSHERIENFADTNIFLFGLLFFSLFLFTNWQPGSALPNKLCQTKQKLSN